jgi:hypothetical protein
MEQQAIALGMTSGAGGSGWHGESRMLSLTNRVAQGGLKVGAI